MKKRPGRPFLLAIIALSIFFASFSSAGCGHRKRRVPIAAAPRINDVETGVASWYGIPYHGRRAANGEIYDMEQLTAAHRTLPFGTWVQVNNLDNGQSVTVRITDRGPFIDGRIIDLSKAAAREIDMIGPGLAKVRVTIVAQPALFTNTAHFAIQIGAFQDRERAESLRRTFETEYGVAKVVPRSSRPPVYRVLVGDEPDLDSANRLQERIRQSGQTTFVVRLDDVPAQD